MCVEPAQAPQMAGASKRLRRKTCVSIRNQEDVLVQTFAKWVSFLIEPTKWNISLRGWIIFRTTRLLSKGLRDVCDTQILVTFFVNTSMVFQVLNCLPADMLVWLSQTDGGRHRINPIIIPSDTGLGIARYHKFFALPWLGFVPILRSWCTDTARRSLVTNNLWQQTCKQIFDECGWFGFGGPVHLGSICLPTWSFRDQHWSFLLFGLALPCPSGCLHVDLTMSVDFIDGIVLLLMG